MAAKKYNLNIAEFDTIVESFVSSMGDKYSHSKSTPTGQIIYRIKETGAKKDVAILTCYNSLGRTSFSFGGKKQDIAQKCSYKLIELSEMKIQESKIFTIKPASDDEVDTIIDFLTEECNCTIEDLKLPSDTIKKLAKITGEYGDIITLTHYTTDTLMVQGRPCMIYLSFIDIATALFNPSEIKKEHLKTYDIKEGDNVLDANLSSHLPNAYPKVGAKLDAIMAPSLILLNTPKDITDYTSYAFPVLRGSEGVLKKVFYDAGVPITDGFGDYFKINHTGTSAEWVKDCSVLFPNSTIRKSLLDLYLFYNKERHTLFHTDATIETSRTLNYNDALVIVKNGLNLIDDIFKHLN